jgi:isoquinoline 1-oxidoreductase subunit alpha
MALFDLKINGTSRSVDVSDDTPLLWVLRDELNMCGTKYGCGIAQCGACTVHLNGIPTRSCVLPVSALGNSEITTIEGLSKDGSHPVQKAWDQLDVPQCGYCQAGQMMTAAAFVSENKNPSDEEISTAMSGNICRCGTYHRIKEAVKLAANLSK